MLPLSTMSGAAQIVAGIGHEAALRLERALEPVEHRVQDRDEAVEYLRDLRVSR